MEAGRHGRLWVALGVLHSGRRIGSILHLSAADHDLGGGTVTWRAKYAKAENYGHGDVVRPMTALHAGVLAWALEHHPNPGGPAAPLLWSPEDPALPVSPSTMYRDWHALEREAGVEVVEGRAFHSMRRAIVTLLSPMLGLETAADFVGMTPATANSFDYRQTLPEEMRKAAGAIDSSMEGKE
jgi:integrase